MRNDEMESDVHRLARPTRSAEAAGAWSIVTVLRRLGPRIAAMKESVTLSRLAALSLVVLFGAIMLSAPWFAQAQDDTTPLSAAFDLDSLNTHARSMWSDGETMWVGDSTDEMIYAYKLVDDPSTTMVNEYGTRDSTKDITGPSSEAFYVTGDDTYLYAVEESLVGTERDVFAYNLADLSRAITKDFDYTESTFAITIVRALATDGEHVWLSPANSNANAYRLSDDLSTTMHGRVRHQSQLAGLDVSPQRCFNRALHRRDNDLGDQVGFTYHNRREPESRRRRRCGLRFHARHRQLRSQGHLVRWPDHVRRRRK